MSKSARFYRRMQMKKCDPEYTGIDCTMIRYICKT